MRIATAGIVRQVALFAAGVDGQQSHALRHVVVQLARKARALLFLCIDQAPAQLVCRLFRSPAVGVLAAQAAAIDQKHSDEDSLNYANRGGPDHMPLVLIPHARRTKSPLAAAR